MTDSANGDGNGLSLTEIDPAVPHVARIYDYLLGGQANFEADRRAA